MEGKGNENCQRQYPVAQLEQLDVDSGNFERNKEQMKQAGMINLSFEHVIGSYIHRLIVN